MYAIGYALGCTKQVVQIASLSINTSLEPMDPKVLGTHVLNYKQEQIGLWNESKEEIRLDAIATF